MSTSSLIIILIFIASGVYIHYRGQVRHGFWRQLTDHSTLMAPVNCFMYMFSGVPNHPFIPVDTLPELKLLEDNWEVLREEALALKNQGSIKRSDKLDDIAFNSFFKTGWSRFYLKWYKDYLPSAQAACPKTLALLDRCPNVKAAMFVVLPPDARLTKHRDPFAGSLRYHLGLNTPNSEDCYINVDGQRYYWQDGEPVLFDETYIHYAKNNTDRDRLILFCDIERPMSNVVARYINKIFSRLFMVAATTGNEARESKGLFNIVFHYLYQVRLVGKRLKQYNRTAYYFVKYALFAALVYWLFF